MSPTLRTIAARYQVNLKARSPIPLNATRMDLPGLCRALQVRRGAEVGVWTGLFSQLMCAGNPALEQWLCIDPWAPYAAYREKKNEAALIEKAYQEAQRRLQPYPCCTFLQMSSMEAIAAVPDRSLDVVYLDGNHEEAFVAEDLRAWSRKLRPGGLLAGHDYRVHPEKPYIQVKAAVDRHVAAHRIAPWFLFERERTPSFLWVVP